MMTFEPTHTNVAARPMAKAVFSSPLVARLGHTPRTMTKSGLEVVIPLVSSRSCTLELRDGQRVLLTPNGLL